MLLRGIIALPSPYACPVITVNVSPSLDQRKCLAFDCRTVAASSPVVTSTTKISRTELTAKYLASDEKRRAVENDS